MAVQRPGSKSAPVLAAVGAVHSEASGVCGPVAGRLQQQNNRRGRTEADAATRRARARVHTPAIEVLASSDRLGEDSAKEPSDGELEEFDFVERKEIVLFKTRFEALFVEESVRLNRSIRTFLKRAAGRPTGLKKEQKN